MKVLLYSVHERTNGSLKEYPLRIIDDTEVKERVVQLIENDPHYQRTGLTNPLYKNLHIAYLSFGQVVEGVEYPVQDIK